MLQYAFPVVLVNNAVTTSKNLSLSFKKQQKIMIKLYFAEQTPEKVFSVRP